MKKIRCECPETGATSPALEYLYSDEERPGMNHKPNECKGTYNIRKYKRGDKELYLCSCCWLTEDTLIGEEL